MSIRRAVLLGAWVLVAVNLVLAFGAIALLTRMAPAIATIIEQNDRSLEAGEEMLGVLATPRDGEEAEARRARFLQAFQRAEHNITEAEERPILARVLDGAEAALAGDEVARRAEILAIQQLAAINRGAMRTADLDAQRLCMAGAWGVALLAVLSFAAALLFIRMVSRRVLAPIEEMQDTLRAVEQGDLHRRCTSSGEAADLRAILLAINGMLDRLQLADPRVMPGERA